MWMLRGLVLIVFFYFLPLGTYSWGFFAHRYINFHAVFLLPPEMIGFYKQHIQYLTSHAVDPDKRRYILPDEAPRHYIDLDRFKQNGKYILPTKWDEAVDMFSEDSLQAYGIVPWWIQIMQFKLTKAFIEKNKDEILKCSADIGHYIGDAHVPLHASSNHNGQLSNQIGIHGFWESRLPELFAANQYDMFIDKASYLKQPLEFIWNRVYQSAAAADTVLGVEKQLSMQKSDQHIFSYEKRNGKYEKVYSVTYASKYHQALQGMVERRMRDATHAIACFWYTAWVEAGQPNLSEISHPK
jgi:hypothetical protein